MKFPGPVVYASLFAFVLGVPQLVCAQGRLMANRISRECGISER